MDTILITIVSLVIIALILIVAALFVIQKSKSQKIKKRLNELEIEKNKIDSAPIIPELTKVENLVKNEKLETMYNKWKDRLDVIRTNQIPKITDMLLDANYSLSQQEYKDTICKIAKLEMELYKVRTNSEFLLNEIKEITTSEERNRTIITNLKAKYRELYEKFKNSKGDYADVADPIELQFENIAFKFEDFEKLMEQNEFTEIPGVVKNIDEMIKHMNVVIEEMPSLILMASNILPKKITEVTEEYNKMLQEGFPLDYLNIEYNVEEAYKKINDIKERAKNLNLEDSLFELKILSDYFDSAFTDFEKEKLNKGVFEEASRVFSKKLHRNNHLMEELFNQLDDIKNVYNLKEDEIKTLEDVRSEINSLNDDYKVLNDHTGNNTFAYSKLTKEIENLSLKLANCEEKVDLVLNSIGNMKDDEVRARQQLEEIKLILNESKHKIREYNLPVIPKTYYVELSEAQSAIKEIVKELEKKPITIDVLNTRVDTARDLALKLFKTTKEMMRTAMFAEMAIVYGNRYRSEQEDLDKYLIYAEKLFFNGEYQKSLEITINSLNKVEEGIYDKLLNLYSNENS